MPGWNPVPAALPKGPAGPGGKPAGAPAGTPGGAPITAGGVKSFAAKNRTTLLAAGAGGVVLLALVMKNRAGTGGDGSAAAGSLTTQPQNAAAYDSSSSDVYNAIQPQLEALKELYSEWKLNKDETSTVPVPTTPDTSKVPELTPSTTGLTGLIGTEGTPSTIRQAIAALLPKNLATTWDLDALSQTLATTSGPKSILSTTNGTVVQAGNTLTYAAPHGVTSTLNTTGRTTAELQKELAKQLSTPIGRTNIGQITLLETAIKNQGG